MALLLPRHARNRRNRPRRTQGLYGMPGSNFVRPTLRVQPAQAPDRTASEQRGEQRRIAKDLTEDFAEAVRGKGFGLRTRREGSRLNPIEESMLGHPYEDQFELPIFIGEQWLLSANEAVADATDHTVEWGQNTFTADRVGFGQMLNETTHKFTIPPGLSGVWNVSGSVRWDANVTGHRNAIVVHNATEVFASRIKGTDTVTTQVFNTFILAEEDDKVFIRVHQTSTASLDLVGGAKYNQVCIRFVGT